MKFGIIPNLSKDTELSFTRELIDWLKQKNTGILINEGIAFRLNMQELGCSTENLLSGCDIVIVLGGDGTLLNIARQAALYDVPIFGINLGHLGFLTEADTSNMYAALERLLAGDYYIEKRTMLEAFIENDTIATEKFLALNDIGITRGTFSRIISYSIFINDNFVDLYSADGIIVSSPTGSTAYSLSAGGPIVDPHVNVLIITPICPHTLHSRSIVVSGEDTVRIEVADSNTEVMLTVDGQHGYKIKPGDTITVRQAQNYTSLVKLNENNFFEVLRRKMSERWNSKNN